MEVSYKFVNFGEDLPPEKDTIILDVGMKTAPGVIDHHHPQAEPECTASLIVKHPGLILDHLNIRELMQKSVQTRALQIITHRLPDFDALSSIFLCLKLMEIGRVDLSMEKIAQYTKLVDSASLPRDIDLSSTPYAVLRALFAGAKKDEAEINRDRLHEGLKFMRFLYGKSEEGYEIRENRLLFSGIDRYERAMRKVEEDYFGYLHDFSLAQKISIVLPQASGAGTKKVDGLIVRDPRSFLLKEWARRDKEHSSLQQGFTLLLTDFWNQRYIIGVDPEQGVNLKGLAEILNRRESEKRAAWGKPPGLRWYDGNCPFFNFRIIDSPQDGTLLSHQEVVEGLWEFHQKLEGAARSPR